MFVIKRKNGEWAKGHSRAYRETTTDFSKARVFTRLTDAKNSDHYCEGSVIYTINVTLGEAIA